MTWTAGRRRQELTFLQLRVSDYRRYRRPGRPSGGEAFASRHREILSMAHPSFSAALHFHAVRASLAACFQTRTRLHVFIYTSASERRLVSRTARFFRGRARERRTQTQTRVIAPEIRYRRYRESRNRKSLGTEYLPRVPSNQGNVPRRSHTALSHRSRLVLARASALRWRERCPEDGPIPPVRRAAIFAGPIWPAEKKERNSSSREGGREGETWFSSSRLARNLGPRGRNSALPFLHFRSPFLLPISLSLSLSLAARRGRSGGASEPFIIFLVTSHPGKTSWQRNYVCNGSTPRPRPRPPRSCYHSSSAQCSPCLSPLCPFAMAVLPLARNLLVPVLPQTAAPSR